MADTYKLQPRTPGIAPSSPPATVTPTSGSGEVKQKPPGRLVSLDAYRGFIMTMLAANGFGIAAFAALPENSEVWNDWDYGWFQRLSFHFTHPDWESITGWMGVSFWDMIQPSFMFMVGVAMPFSYKRRSVMGSSSKWLTLHALWRAIVLVLMGVFLYSLGQKQTTWMFTNVLAQIGLGYFFTYLLLGRSLNVQVGAIAVILVGYWGLFVMNPPPEDFDYTDLKVSQERGEVYEGRFAPWTKNSNVAHTFEVWFLNSLRMPAGENGGRDIEQAKEAAGPIRRWWFSSPVEFTHNRGGYATLNFVPSIATMLLGVLCGQLMLSRRSHGDKLMRLLLGGAFCLALGIAAHHSVCPIVKRIWTPSWVLFSGGYTMWMLAGFYLLFDVLPLKKLAFPLVVVGMNSIVMYMLGQMLRGWTRDKIVKTHFAGVLESMFGPNAVNPDHIGAMILPTATFAVFWLIAYWMFRNRFFVRV